MPFKRKTMGKVRNHRYIKLIASEARRNYFCIRTKLSCNETFSDNILARNM